MTPRKGADGASGLLAQGLALLEVPGGERTSAILGGYLAELEKWNPRFGFVNASGTELVVKHVLDSLSAWRLVLHLVSGERPPRDSAEDAASAFAGTVLDVGSGAGLPGIPLAAALPSLSFTLLERSAKRAAFLENCALVLGLANVRVLETDITLAGSRLPSAASTRPARFDVVTFRAVAPLDRFIKDLRASGLDWGSIVAFKGKEAKAREEIEAMKTASAVPLTAEILDAEVPFLEEERHLVVIRAGGMQDVRAGRT